MKPKVYKYELQVFWAGYWHSRGHYESRKSAWLDYINDKSEYRNYKHRVVISDYPYYEY